MTMQDEDPDQILANYSKVKLQCRVDRHRWGRKVFYSQEAPNFARRYVTCSDCATQRWVEINIKTYEWTGRSGYNYSKGYLTLGTGLTRDDFRERLYREDFADAKADGRVEYAVPAEDEPEVVTPIDKKTKKAS